MTMAPPRRLYLAVWGLAGTLVLGLAAAVAGLLWQTRADGLAAAEARVTRFAAGAETGMNRTLLSLDMLLASTGELLRVGERSSLDVDGANALLRAMVRQNLMLRHVALFDARGEQLASSAQGQEPPPARLPPGLLATALAPAVATLTVGQPQAAAPGPGQVLYAARPLRLADGMSLLAVAQVPMDVLVSVLLQGEGAAPEVEVTLGARAGRAAHGPAGPLGCARAPGPGGAAAAGDGRTGPSHRVLAGARAPVRPAGAGGRAAGALSR
jgi:hypothetical protein